MFQSDLETVMIAMEKQRQRLQEAEAFRRALQQKQGRPQIHFRAWLGTQLIVLGQRIKGGRN